MKPPSWNQIRKDAAAFASRWADATDEASEAQSFWTEFLAIFGVDRKRVAVFEMRAERLSTGGRGRIDLFWPGVMIAEHKSAGKDLDAAQEQAIDYLESIDPDAFPGLLVVSDFARMRVADLQGDKTSYEFPLSDLEKEIDRFGFLAGYANRQLSSTRQHEADIAAARSMGALYESLAGTGFTEHEISVFMVRMLFILFGDDAGLWEKSLFLEFLETRTQKDGSDLGTQLAWVFQTLNRPVEQRSANLDELLARFPYVNGGLFADQLTIPACDGSIRQALLDACHIDWSAIYPAIFGSLFQAVKSKEDRRHLGEHYTSETNILKVIGPLFLDDLRDEFEKSRNDAKKLQALRARMGTMKFLDPACGCGNFLVIAYREMRALELDILTRLQELTGQSQLSLDATLGLEVSPSQFYGIEVEEWPARIAETAMFLVDHQANQALARKFGQAPDRLPISTTATIVHGNALRLAWDEVVPGFDSNTRIMGNPPFLGSLLLSEQQKEDARFVWGDFKRLGTMDFVTNWFVLAARLVHRYGCSSAFVSTNSITQGEQVAALWSELGKSGVAISFAHQTFAWSNEAAGQAAVHVVIVGLASKAPGSARLFTYDHIKGSPEERDVPAINPYLVPGDLLTVGNRGTPLNPGQVQMRFGSMPRDGGWLSKIDPATAKEIRASDPIAAKYLKPLIGAEELINGGERYCLWLVDAEPSDLRSSPVLRERLAKVRQMRAESKAASTRKWADSPGLFVQNGQPTTRYLAVPGVSSENRAYVPMALFEPDVIASNALLTVSDADLFTFGLLQSVAFSYWNATVSGRLESRYRVSAEITYHNFPYPEAKPEQRAAVEQAAQRVLEARESHPASTLADLYDPLAMPKDLLEAHRALDRAVLAAYGLPGDADETAVLSRLFSLYEELTRADELTFEESKPKRKAVKRKPKAG
ncbi:MAG: N-6 DNA methylase [Candidatus Nanopelagicales bacterium]|nr:N-6 DNA methylase [Candidatus Nanopelagicales bacterium]